MTRKKDKIKEKNEFIRKKRNLSNSRLLQQQQDVSKESNLLKKIKALPDELIRIIYNYMSNNAKLFCNFKLDYIEKKLKSYELYCNINSIRDLSKKEFLNMINKGILGKFPDIIESIEDFYYSLDNNYVYRYSHLNGQNLFNLWEKNSLVIDVYNENYSSKDEELNHIDWSIKYNTKDSIIDYIKNTLQIYNINKSRTITQKNWIFNDNTLFWKTDKIFLLYKCIEYLILRKNKKL